MKAFILYTLLTSILSFNLRQTKQNYDSYVLALQWPNGYCKTNNCGNKANHVDKNILTIHGLWPSLKTGKSLNDCTSGIIIKEKDNQLFKDLNKYWSSFSKTNINFWQHEYNKHGFCMVEEKGWSGYEQYFKFVLSLYFKNYKDLIIKAFPNKREKIIIVTYDEMKKKIQSIIPKANFKMNCKSQFIYEFYFYLEKDFTPSKNSRFSNTCSSGKLVFN